LLVDGRVYSESRLVHVTPPVNTRAAQVVGAHEPQALHHWEGVENGTGH